MKTISKITYVMILIIIIFQVNKLNAQWVETSPLINGFIKTICVKDSSIYIGSSSNGIFNSNDLGLTWTQINNGISSNTQVNSVNESYPYIFAATNFAGIYRTIDNGLNWTQVNTGLPINPNVIYLSALGNSIIAVVPNNIYKSVNYGDNWTLTNTGLPSFFYPLAILSINSSFFLGTDQGLYKSNDFGSTWNNITNSLGTIYVKKLASNGTVLYVTTNGQSYKSMDMGLTWGLLTLPFNAPTAIYAKDSLVLISKNSQTIYLSSNYGSTWKLFDYGMSNQNVFSFAQKDSLIFFGGSYYGKRNINDAFVTIGSLTSISGPSVVCSNDTNVMFTTQSIQGADKYIWTFPGGIIDTTVSNSIYHNFAGNSQSGLVKVKALNLRIGHSNEVSMTITVNAIPLNPQNIFGPINVYKGQVGVKYKVTPVVGAVSYSWLLSSGMTGNSNSDSILVNFASMCQSGNLSIKAINNCGESQYINLFVTVIDSGYFELKTSVNNIINDTVNLFLGDTVFLKTEIFTKYIYNGFNNGQLGNGWSNTGSVLFNNPCQCPFINGLPSTNCPNGSPGQFGPDNIFAWVNSITTTSSITTPQYCLQNNNLNNCKIKFWMMYGNSSSNSSSVCDAPDFFDEGIHLQYSTNNGYSWNDFPGANSDPIGNLSPIPPFNTSTPGHGGYWIPLFSASQRINSTLYYWNLYENYIPILESTANTKYRWAQITSSNTGYDTWGIDEVEISCNASSIYHTQWIYNGNIISTSTEPTPFVLTQGGYYQYIVSVTDSISSYTVSDTIVVFIQPKPAAAGIIIGPDTICTFSSSKIFTVPPIANATSYIWTLPSGYNGSSNTNSIIVNFQYSTLQSGYISVKGHNSSGDGVASSKYVTVLGGIPGNAGIISGLSTVCQGQDSVIYSIPAISNTQTYLWTFGNTNYSTNTNQILLNIPDNALNPLVLSVKGTNSCINIYGGSSSKSIVVNPLPHKLLTISGSDTVCQGQTSVVYKASFLNADSYIWTLPNGTNSIFLNDSVIVDFSFNSQSDYITVKGVNNCGSPDIDSLFVYIVNIPSQVFISLQADTLISSSINGNQWYELSMGAIPGATLTYYVPQQNGEYAVIVSINGCVSDASDFYHVDFVGTNEYLQKKFNLKVYPNPFSHITQFTYKLNENQKVNFKIFDITGRLVNLLVDENQTEGEHQLIFDAGKIQSGIYYYYFTVGNEVAKGKIILAK